MATQEAIGKRSPALPEVEEFETIVIGGGQAGLSVGYYLKQQGQTFVVLDANERIGGSWRTRTWNSLRLFTPARYDGLPGWPFPAPGWSYPTRRAFRPPGAAPDARRPAVQDGRQIPHRVR